MIFRRSAALAAVSLSSLVSQYAAADFDFRPKVVAGRVAAGGHDDELGVDVDTLRVADYAFGEEPGDPYNFGDPGFNTVGASAFTPGSQLRLMPRPIDGVGLRYWNGTGTPTFTAAPSAVSIDLAGSPTRFATFAAAGTTDTPVTDTSLLIGSFNSTNGAIHIHLTSSIFSNRQQYGVDGSPVDIPAGAYLISFLLTNPGTGLAASDPLYIVYNNQLSDDQNDAAVAAATAAYVPEPASVAGLAVAGGWLLRRRRKEIAGLPRP